MNLQLIEILGLGGLLRNGGIHIFRTRQLQSATNDRTQLAFSRDWSYSEAEEGTLWRLSGAHDGLAWVCDARRPRRTGPREYDDPHRTRFEIPLQGGCAMLGPRVPDGVAGTVVRQRITGTQGGPIASRSGSGGPRPARMRPGRPVPTMSRGAWCRSGSSEGFEGAYGA